MLTGRYHQNTGVEVNSYRPFPPHEGETVAVALHEAGYRTGLFGKYLNGYPGPLGPGHVPPGWDRWFVMTSPGYGAAKGYFGYGVDDQGTVRRYGASPADYSTDVLGAEALGFVRQALADGVPFFAELALHAPHVPSAPAPRDADALAGAAAPRGPAFDEADVSDKPAYVRGRRPLDALARAGIDRRYRDMARSLLAVDRAVAALVKALADAGALRSTYVVFASDNGWMTGDHRLTAGKGVPYEQASRVPLYVCGPGVAPGSRIGRLVGNADLGPTLAAWGGTSLPGADGRSLVPLLANPAAPWRRAYPAFYRRGADGPGLPGWRGVRTDRYTYVEYDTGERELYDDAADPHQLRNIAGTVGPKLLAKLARRTAALAACEGEGCRTLEDAPL